jgi:hypothetical protein
VEYVLKPTRLENRAYRDRHEKERVTMSSLNRTETNQIKSFVQELVALDTRNDERECGGAPDGLLALLEAPSDQQIETARHLSELLRRRKIACPQLDNFIDDRSPFDVPKVITELGEI